MRGRFYFALFALPIAVWLAAAHTDEVTSIQKTLPGLKERVEILRDRWGVPHIYAQSQDDLFFAQGFVCAQDRLFQMDLWRRLARGETAELLGKERLEGDRLARLLRYRGDLDAEWSCYGR